jgi:hypothetical protein
MGQQARNVMHYFLLTGSVTFHTLVRSLHDVNNYLRYNLNDDIYIIFNIKLEELKF